MSRLSYSKDNAARYSCAFSPERKVWCIPITLGPLEGMKEKQSRIEYSDGVQDKQTQHEAVEQTKNRRKQDLSKDTGQLHIYHV